MNRWRRALGCALVLGGVGVAAARGRSGEAATPPATTVDYGPMAFFPDRWKALGQATTLHPWEGRRVVMLTPTNDLDPGVMGVFLDRLDDAWTYYADVVGQTPRPGTAFGGRPYVAAVPEVRLTCGYGCGQLGSTGIEVTAFTAVDYPLVAKDRSAFPHYYFYEMGRNFYVFGDRHSAFTTGFAVFMRYRCMDALRCRDTDEPTRTQIEQAEAKLAATDLTFLQAFTTQGGMDEKTPRLRGVPGPSDQPVLYASAMMRLHADLGGDAWLRRFYRQLARVPEVRPAWTDGALRQGLAWLVAASAAAERDLTDTFVQRWRFPAGKATRAALAAVPWKQPTLDVAAVLRKLPADPRT